MNPDTRRLAVLGSIRIPFARQNGPYARASHQDMLTAALEALIAGFSLQDEILGEVAAGGVLKHSRDFNLTRECVLGTRVNPHTPAYDVQHPCGTGLEAAILIANTIALGQIGASALEAGPINWERPQAGRFALVTGASRGIGRAIAQVLARDGAHVIGLDLPELGDELKETIGELGDSTLLLDITDDDAPRQIADHVLSNHGGVDVVVHNACVTRDKTLARMSEEQWDMVIAINLTAQERINEELLAREAIRENGRIVCVSSMSGIAGNPGQTNYAASKAGMIGMVHAMAKEVASKRLTINAVAPGFIETQMTAAMPIAAREAGRRMNSLAQGGLRSTWPRR